MAAAAPTLAQIGTVIAKARAVAMEYYQLTGRPLGITGEVGEYEAVRLLGLTLAPAREAGFDATDKNGHRYQVKARCISESGSKKSQRIGSIKLTKPWDAVLLVLLDEKFQPVAIWQAERDAITEALLAPGSKARNERGALGVAKFKKISKLMWQA